MEAAHPTCRSCSVGACCPFRTLTIEARALLERYSRQRVVPRGEILWTMNDPANALYCVHSGLVKVATVGPAGREQILRLAGDGDVLGCISILQNRPHSTSAMAIDATRLCVVPRSTVQKLLAADPGLFVRLLSSVSLTLGTVEGRLLKISRKSVSERLAEALLELQQSYGTETDEATLRLRMKREDLANFVGTTLESVSRLLTRFRNDGMIAVKGRKITIRNRAALAQIAHLN